jgi:hypothetical protein
MANFIYKKAKEAILNGEINFSSNSFKALLVDINAYTVSESTHQFVSDVAAESIMKRSNNLSLVTNTLGVIDADDLIISDYTGEAFGAIILYQVGYSDSVSRLIFYIDSSSGLPFSGSSNNTPVTIFWDKTSINKILSI